MKATHDLPTPERTTLMHRVVYVLILCAAYLGLSAGSDLQAVEKIAFQRGVHVWLMDADGGNQVDLTSGQVGILPSLSPDGTRIVFFKSAPFGGFVVSVMKAEPISASNEPVQVVGASLKRIAWHPDGRRIAYEVNNKVRVLTVLNANGTITPESADNQYIELATGMEPAFSPDGEHLAFSNAGTIYELRAIVEGTVVPESAANPKVPLTRTDFPAPRPYDRSAAYSPDGRSIAFVETQDYIGDNPESRLATLAIRDADGTLTPESAANPRVAFSTATVGSFVFSAPTWRPDGAVIAFGVRNAPTSTIDIFTLLANAPESGTNPRVALTTDGESLEPSFVQPALNLPLLAASTNFRITAGTGSTGWTFRVTQNDANLTLRVQSTITPDSPITWRNLPGGGLMGDEGGGEWRVAGDVPLGHRHFRVEARAQGFAPHRLVSDDEYYVTSPAGRIAYIEHVPARTEGVVTVPPYRRVVVIEADGSDPIVLTDESLYVERCALSADGTMVAFPTYDGGGPGRLFVMKAEPMNGTTNVPVNLLAGSGVAPFSILAWSPSGRHLAFADTAYPTVHIHVLRVTADDGSITPWDAATNPLIEVGTSAVEYPQYPSPAWSPDGRYLAYVDGVVIKALRITDAAGTITPPDGSNQPVALTRADTAPGQPHRPMQVTWAPDNRRLAFIEIELDQFGGYIPRPVLLTARNAAGALTPETVANARTPLYPFSYYDPYALGTVSWSPDGSLLALQVTRGAYIPRVAIVKPEPIDANNPLVLLTDRTSEVPVFSQSKLPLGTLRGPTDFFITTGEPGDPWTFTATLDSEAPGLFLRVQSSLSPEIEGSWTDLSGGGLMERNGSLWTLETSTIPLGTRFFRAIAAATDVQDSKTQFPTSFIVSSPAGRILLTRGSIFDRKLVLMESDGSSRTVLSDDAVLNVSPMASALSPKSEFAAFTTQGGKLYVMKAQPMHALANVPVDVLDGAPATAVLGSSFTWAPDGRHLAFAGSDNRVYVIAAVDEGGDIVAYDAFINPLIDVAGTFSSAPNPVWSPDGRHLALLGANYIQGFQVMDGSGSITPQNDIGNPFVALTLPGDFSSAKRSAAWSPDGQQIAIVERKPDGTQSFISLLNARDANGDLTPESDVNARTPLHDFTADPLAGSISWSPDGSLLALGVTNGGQYHVEVIHPEAIDDDNPRVPLTSFAVDGDAFEPRFGQPVSAQAVTQIAFQAANDAGNEDGDPIVVRVVRTGGSRGELTVGFAVTGGTATLGSASDELGADFTITDGPLVFADSETEKEITITPLMDGADSEGDETVLLALGAPDVGELGALATTTIVIHDADSSLLPFIAPAQELAVAINGKLKKTGSAKSGDEWTFTVRQTLNAHVASLLVKIQATKTPTDPGSWVDLPEGVLSRPTNTSTTWKGSTRSVPTGKIYFRTRSYAVGHRSNAGPVAGPFTVVPAPVLTMNVTMVSDSDPTGLTVKPSEFITYTIKCRNVGAAPALKVVLNSGIPAQTRFDSASHLVPVYFVQETDNKGKMTEVRWNVGTIAPGAEVTEFVTVQVDQIVEFNRLIQNDKLTYKMTGLKETFLPIFRTTIAAPLLISVAKDKSVVVAGDLITYTLTIKNDASFAVTGGTVNNQVPNGTRLVSAAYGNNTGNYLGVDIGADTLPTTPSGLLDPGFTPHDRMLKWNIGDIEAGGTRLLRFTVRVAYDLFEKLSRNGESFDVQIQNLNFDFTGIPPSGGVIAARGGIIPGSDIARTFVSAQPPANRPQLGLRKDAFSDTWALLGDLDIAGIFEDGNRVVEYEVSAWNYGNITADGTIIFDGIPLYTDLFMDDPVTGSAVTDQFTTQTPHGFAVNDRILFPALTVGTGVTANKYYYINSVSNGTTFTVALAVGGPMVNFSKNITAGTVRRGAYDWPRFMSRFTVDDAPVAGPAGFRFFDENGNELSAGGEPYIDTNANAKIDKGEYIDQNGNSKYDGPDKIRGFEYDLGNLPPMTNPNVKKLRYWVRVKPELKSGAFIAAFSAAKHKQGQGLELVSPDFIYPLFGAPDLVFAKVIKKVNFAVDEPAGNAVEVVAGQPETHEIRYEIKFTNTGDLYALDTKLRVPIPAGFTTTSVPLPLARRDAKYDIGILGSPGTAVFDIGVVAPGEIVTRQLTLKLTTPIASSLFGKNGFLKLQVIPLFPSAVSTLASSAAPAAAPAARALLATGGPAIVTMGAFGSNGTATPIRLAPGTPRLFIGRIAPAIIRAGNEFDLVIFCGNHGDGFSATGEIGMQIPYGTAFRSAHHGLLNERDGSGNYTMFEGSSEFKVATVSSTKRRPQDGPIDVVRWHMGSIDAHGMAVVILRLYVTDDFPGTELRDKSCYVKYADAPGKAASPLTIQVIHGSNGAVDAWQAVGNFLSGAGSVLDAALRTLLGSHTEQLDFGAQVVSLGGADYVQLANGSVIIPLGGGRSALIANEVVPPEQKLFNTGLLVLSVGPTDSQQVFVPGIEAYRGVESILAELTDPVASIVAAGGGNIVAAGGGNVVSNDGAGIVAGGGGNFKPGTVATVVSNDGAGLLPGSIRFSELSAAGIVAAGGGNIVAAGGGNIVAAGGGNIVAAGGGNIVAGGGGNLVEIDGKKILSDQMNLLVNKLVGLDGASFTDPKVLKLIGLDGASLVGQDGAGLIGLDGASLVGQDGAGLTGD